MIKTGRLRKAFWLGGLFIVGAILLLSIRAGAPVMAQDFPPPQAPTQEDTYTVIGWNDLGMHCEDDSYDIFSILPPYNTMWAQVVRYPAAGGDPELVTTGVTVEYSFEDNTESASKVNFWDYEDQLFGVDLPLNTGLTGMGMSGDMDPAATYFIAEGVPLTPFTDSEPTVRDPYQLAHLIARHTGTGALLAETTIVAPVSDEMHCEYCHSDGQVEGIATGDVRMNILVIHDMENETDLEHETPVLCADCHASNALEKPGQPNVPNFSLAMHKKHDEYTQDCYDCHPGVETACLRDVMSEDGMWCTDCHGDMLAVGDENREPWIDEPRCETCHPDNAENPDTLFRNSIGHGGVYCEACHNSTHAIVPSREPRDNIQNIALQGRAGTLFHCDVCHSDNVPSGGGPHGILAPPKSVTDLSIASGSIILDWTKIDRRLSGQKLNSATYNIYRAANTPYFIPGTDSYDADTSPTYTDADPDALGNLALNNFYVITVVDPDGYESTLSNRVGGFNFVLVPGSS